MIGKRARRIADLHSLHILDTAAEERFDRVTRIARRLFDVPIALVSLVDEDRQWFKSCFGLNASETPRDISFCGHAILGTDTLKKSFRESDVFARLGGDEFVVFMSGASRSVAQVAIKRFSEAIEQYNHAANRGYDLSFCAGIVAVDPNSNISLDDLLCQADSAMYDEKSKIKKSS
ncbi:TPA: diguanylate cyclase [Vibrio vulnificus]|nr:diguanylate cyclase [Vibrio vulnificus]HDY7578416.1 GGDEF domain-containing protein [Vibrio vulnificus]